MIEWIDTGIILKNYSYGEHHTILQILTKTHGRYGGILKYGKSKKNRTFQVGTFVQARWHARLSEHLGEWSLEVVEQSFLNFFDSPKKLMVLELACQLTALLLPERQVYENFYNEWFIFLKGLEDIDWKKYYINHEIQLLQELGFALRLNECSVTGQKSNLVYVSPKTGCAVTDSVGTPYADRLLKLPGFLSKDSKNNQETCPPTESDFKDGFELTGFFLEHHFPEFQFQELFKMRKRVLESL